MNSNLIELNKGVQNTFILGQRFITNCGGLFITKCDNFVTKSDGIAYCDGTVVFGGRGLFNKFSTLLIDFASVNMLCRNMILWYVTVVCENIISSQCIVVLSVHNSVGITSLLMFRPQIPLDNFFLFRKILLSSFATVLHTRHQLHVKTPTA